MATDFDDLVSDLERSYEETQTRMADPAVYNDHREAADVGRRLKELEQPYKLAQEWKSARDDLAAAHAACFSMALSAGLSKDGHPPDELRTSATVTFQPGEGITRVALTVEGRVPGLDEAAFEAAARTAKENCPVSTALAAVPEISLDAALA